MASGGLVVSDLFQLIRSGSSDMFTSFRKSIASVENITRAMNSDGNTALHHASMRGYYDIVKLLCESSHIDVNIQNKHGQSALHFSCAEGHLGVTRYLLAEGHGNPHLPDKLGRSALSIASKSQDPDIKEFMRQYDIPLSQPSQPPPLPPPPPPLPTVPLPQQSLRPDSLVYNPPPKRQNASGEPEPSSIPVSIPKPDDSTTALPGTPVQPTPTGHTSTKQDQIEKFIDKMNIKRTVGDFNIDITRLNVKEKTVMRTALQRELLDWTLVEAMSPEDIAYMKKITLNIDILNKQIAHEILSESSNGKLISTSRNANNGFEENNNYSNNNILEVEGETSFTSVRSVYLDESFIIDEDDDTASGEAPCPTTTGVGIDEPVNEAYFSSIAISPLASSSANHLHLMPNTGVKDISVKNIFLNADFQRDNEMQYYFTGTVERDLELLRLDIAQLLVSSGATKLLSNNGHFTPSDHTRQCILTPEQLQFVTQITEDSNRVEMENLHRRREWTSKAAVMTAIEKTFSRLQEEEAAAAEHHQEEGKQNRGVHSTMNSFNYGSPNAQCNGHYEGNFFTGSAKSVPVGSFVDSVVSGRIYQQQSTPSDGLGRIPDVTNDAVTHSLGAEHGKKDGDCRSLRGMLHNKSSSNEVEGASEMMKVKSDEAQDFDSQDTAYLALDDATSTISRTESGRREFKKNGFSRPKILPKCADASEAFEVKRPADVWK